MSTEKSFSVVRATWALICVLCAASSVAQDTQYRVYAPGVLARTVYTTRDRVEVVIMDLMVGPGKASEDVKLPGVAVLEVRAGTGALVQGGNRGELHMGSTTTVSEGTPFRLINASPDRALVLHAVIVRPTTQ